MCEWDRNPNKRMNGRESQVQQWSVQSDDADPTTGDRVKYSGNPRSATHASTNWFEDLSTVPGSSKRAAAEGCVTAPFILYGA